jgi:hypothetical protein
LARSHGPADRAAAGEQIFARLLTRRHEVVVDGLSRPVHQIEHGELSDAPLKRVDRIGGNGRSFR